MEAKKPWESKTNWVALVIAGLSFWPEAAAWVSAHSDTFMQLSGFVFLALRMVTKGKISIG